MTGSEKPAGQFVNNISTKPVVVIWSGEHRAWWRANKRGYTTDPATAGRYTLPEAVYETNHCGPEKKIRIEDPPNVPERRLEDNELRGLVRQLDGSIYGPNVEHVSIPLKNFWRLHEAIEARYRERIAETKTFTTGSGCE